MQYAIIFIILLMLVLNVVFKIASVFRLSIPLIYVFALPIFFPNWLGENEPLALGILIAMLVLVVISWVMTIRNKIENRRRQKQFDGSWD